VIRFVGLGKMGGTGNRYRLFVGNVVGIIWLEGMNGNAKLSLDLQKVGSCNTNWSSPEYDASAWSHVSRFFAF
jgi:hypothetical protein